MLTWGCLPTALFFIGMGVFFVLLQVGIILLGGVECHQCR